MLTIRSHLDGYQDVGDQLAAHLRRRADVAAARTGVEKRGLADRDSFERRRQRVRAHFLDAIGGLPELASGAAARVTGTTVQPGFRIDNLLLETVPGALASANLYMPEAASGDHPVPGVLFVCGHSREAKAYPTYQQVCRSMVRAGIAVLALDPPGQGERMQYVDPRTGDLQVEWGTTEHAHVGLQCHVAGFGLARYFIADAMAALGYLAARPEVDPARLGVTGSSGGGTQASYLMCLDPRLACGAPCTYITSRSAYMDTGQAHDAEQNVWRAVAEGLDYDDLLAAMAPKPVMIGAAASDFFCIEGALAAYESLCGAYALYGRQEDLYLVVAPGTHAYSATLRDRVTRFLRRHLLGEDVDLPRGLSSYAPPAEGPVPAAPAPDVPEEHVLPAEALRATRSGQVHTDHPEARTVFDLNVAAWRAAVGPAAGAGDLDARFVRLAEAVVGGRPRPPMWVREVRAGESDGIRWAHRYAFTEPRIAVPMIVVSGVDAAPEGPSPGGIAVAALAEGTLAVESRPDFVRELVRQVGRVLLFDARGSGAAEQRPVNASGAGRFGSLFKLHYDAMMLGDSLFAMRAFDALRVLDYAHRIASRVEVYGEGTPGLELLAACALDGSVAAARFQGLLRSFADIVTTRLHRADRLLEVYGLTRWPDVADLLARIPTVDCAFVDARGEPWQA